MGEERVGRDASGSYGARPPHGGDVRRLYGARPLYNGDVRRLYGARPLYNGDVHRLYGTRPPVMWGSVDLQLHEAGALDPGALEA